ncbi:hypothetical protein DAEQUDRAFT_814084 [Daedalea quercina L-15889]|uniref:Uncharacterized protein n=1 Tax=Daedalea quercina L-15889 TaxID=1314783 RepID=A0A165MH38_9APHY|nr:hypothetical protein DAEQUDRAFT_814084 [Daedalea quercina L-15889]
MRARRDTRLSVADQKEILSFLLRFVVDQLLSLPGIALSESMQDLSLEDSKSVNAAPRRVKQPPVVPKPVCWPKLPEGWRESDRYFVLGWDVEHPRLQELVRIHTREEAKNLWYLIRAPGILEYGSGWRHIRLCNVLPEDACPPEPWDDPNGPRKALIAIASTASKYLYNRRPTREQYIWLQQIFGCRPQWYRDSLPKQYFHLQDIPRYC